MRTQCNVNNEIKVIRHKDKKILGRVQCYFFPCVVVFMLLCFCYLIMSGCRHCKQNDIIYFLCR